MARGTWQTTSGGGGRAALAVAAVAVVVVFAAATGRGAGHAVAQVMDLLPWLLAGGAVVVAVATIAVVAVFRRASRPGMAGHGYQVAGRPVVAGISGQPPPPARVAGQVGGHRVAITTGQETAAGKVTTTTVLEASSEGLLAQLVDIHGPAIGTGHAQRAGMLPAGEDQG
jgi:hypothetical protein